MSKGNTKKLNAIIWNGNKMQLKIFVLGDVKTLNNTISYTGKFRLVTFHDKQLNLLNRSDLQFDGSSPS